MIPTETQGEKHFPEIGLDQTTHMSNLCHSQNPASKDHWLLRTGAPLEDAGDGVGGIKVNDLILTVMCLN